MVGKKAIQCARSLAPTYLLSNKPGKKMKKNRKNLVRPALLDELDAKLDRLIFCAALAQIQGEGRDNHERGWGRCSQAAERARANEAVAEEQARAVDHGLVLWKTLPVPSALSQDETPSIEGWCDA